MVSLRFVFVMEGGQSVKGCVIDNNTTTHLPPQFQSEVLIRISPNHSGQTNNPQTTTAQHSRLRARPILFF